MKKKIIIGLTIGMILLGMIGFIFKNIDRETNGVDKGSTFRNNNHGGSHKLDFDGFSKRFGRDDD